MFFGIGSHNLHIIKIAQGCHDDSQVEIHQWTHKTKSTEHDCTKENA